MTSALGSQYKKDWNHKIVGMKMYKEVIVQTVSYLLCCNAINIMLHCAF